MFGNKQFGLGAAAIALLLAADLSSGCSSDDSTAEPGATTGVGAGSTTGTGGSTGGSGATGGSNGTGGTGGTTSGSGGQRVPPPPTETSECQGHIYECGDLEDNDGDGLVDYQDPDCLGPCDNTEGSLFGGIPGQNVSPCTQDCYFDQDTGQGNDTCYWSHWCDPYSVAPDYYPEPKNGAVCEYDPNKAVPVSEGAPKSCDELQQAQAQNCYDYCGPLTPNGCDCFGCCELPAGEGNYIWLGSTGADGTTVCTGDQLNNPDVCHPCTPVQSCLNDCDTCELCVGKTTLPEECFNGEGGGGTGGSGGSPQECPPGVQPCGLPGQDPCASGQYCVTGCCHDVPQ